MDNLHEEAMQLADSHSAYKLAKMMLIEQKERIELAAHVDQLILALKDARLSLEHARVFISSRQKMHQVGAEGHEDSITKIYLALKNTPATSLARRDLIKQAEVLEYMGEEVKNMHLKANKNGIAAHLAHVSRAYRQRANQLETN